VAGNRTAATMKMLIRPCFMSELALFGGSGHSKLRLLGGWLCPVSS
jgi:hypothetical protein